MENLFYQPGIISGIDYLNPEESRHCAKVLRKKYGDTIRVTDGEGSYYDVELITANPTQCRFKIISRVPASKKTYRIHLAVSPTKNPDRIEWLVEKCVEIGIDEITLIRCQHTERSSVKMDRLNKLAVSAMKQSVQAFLPKLNPVTSLTDMLNRTAVPSRFIAYVDSSNPHHLMARAKPGGEYLVLIGPEGDFSTEELALAKKNGFTPVSLGSNRMRTETAALAACHILNLVNL